MTTFRLAGVDVPRIGLGTNRLTTAPEHVRFIRDAVAAGVRHIDTAHLYTGGESERVIGEALDGTAEEVLVATKGGFRAGDAPVAVHDAVAQPRCCPPRDLRVSVLRFDMDLAGSLAEHSEMPQERGTPQTVSLNILGRSITDQVSDRRGRVEHLAQQQELTPRRAAAPRRAPARGCTC
jgi:hypothetical protein